MCTAGRAADCLVMATHARRRMAAIGVAAAMAVGGWQLVEQAGTAPIPTSGPQEVAAIRRAPAPWWMPATARPRPTTTTVRPTTTTTRPPTTTTPPTTTPPTTTRPPTTTTRPPATTTTRPPAATTTTPPPATTATTQPPTPTTVAPTGGLSSAQLGEMLSLVNAKRATGTTCGGTAYPPVPALSLQSQISSAADAHARDMAARNYFSHTGANGSDPGQRMTAAGYRWSAWAENIAAGQATTTAAVNGWFASTGHCVNFMSSVVTQIGFGKAENPSSSYRIYWVADLGRPG